MSSTGTAAMPSSTTLWATASKEWVIQPKPKPGRKPKKDATPVKDTEEVDSKGRRIQNRAAQRAFRERKQSQLAELQARVQSYEQGEIERNVALQNIAKRLKEENESLRRENILLKERISRIEQEQELQGDKRRWRDDSPLSSASSATFPVRKKARAAPGSPQIRASTLTTPSYLPSPPSMVSSPDSNGTPDTRFSPLPFSPQPDPAHTSLSNLLDFPSHVKAANLEAGSVFPAFDCGFCNENTPCVCREIAAHQAAERMSAANLKAEHYGQNNSAIHINSSSQLETPPSSNRSSILDNLPAYQPPMPLRRRPVGSNVNTIFRIFPPQPQASSSSPQCSGDPSNCMACADDSFGKAFCSAIGESIASQASCVDCPCKADEAVKAEVCGGSTSCDCQLTVAVPPTTHIPLPETMPTNDAWGQLKSHPNVAFADLSLLAEVVARRSKCTGPRVVISPAPGSITPERPDSPDRSARYGEPGPVLLTDPHARYHEKERAWSHGPSSPPQLVPQEVLIRCGRQRVREVHADAVREALRLLDAKFARP